MVKAPFLTKGIFSPEDSIETIEKDIKKKPSKIPAKEREKLILIAKKLKNMVATPGWSDVIQPLLSQRGNPALLFDFFDQKGDRNVSEHDIAVCKAYYQLNNYIKNLIGLGERLIQEEGDNFSQRPQTRGRKPPGR